MIYRDAGVAVRHALSGNTSGGAETDKGINQWRRDNAQKYCSRSPPRAADPAGAEAGPRHGRAGPVAPLPDTPLRRGGGRVVRADPAGDTWHVAGTRGSPGRCAGGVYRDPRQRGQDALDCADGQQGAVVNMSTLLANLCSTEIFLPC